MTETVAQPAPFFRPRRRIQIERRKRSALRPPELQWRKLRRRQRGQVVEETVLVRCTGCGADTRFVAPDSDGVLGNCSCGHCGARWPRLRLARYGS